MELTERICLSLVQKTRFEKNTLLIKLILNLLLTTGTKTLERSYSAGLDPLFDIFPVVFTF